MPLDVVHRVSNRHSYHRINSPSAAVTTSLLFTLSFCLPPRAMCREARQGRRLAPRLNSEGASYFQGKRGFLQPELYFFTPCEIKMLQETVPASPVLDFGLLFFSEDAALSGIMGSSPKPCAGTPPHTQTGVFSIFPKRFNCPF